jgi:hypothetical protein
MAMPSTPVRPVKRRHLGRGLAIGTISLLALAAIGGGVLAYGINQAQGPINAVKAFCNDLKSQSYDAAYALLSNSYQTRLPKTQFLTEAALHDQIDGKVNTCGQPNQGVFTFSLGNVNAERLDDSFTRESKSFAGSISLVKQGSDWKVDSIDSALQGTDLGALQVAQVFCADFVAANYASAYGLLSPKAQQNYGSKQQFVTTFTNAFSGPYKLSDCAPDVTTYRVTSPSAQVTLKADVTVTTSAGSDKIPISPSPALKLVLASGTWQVDELDLSSPGA